jgi:hypothetical protein
MTCTLCGTQLKPADAGVTQDGKPLCMACWINYPINPRTGQHEWIGKKTQGRLFG